MTDRTGTEKTHSALNGIIQSMVNAGFVLTGGRSARMGADKALLAFRGRTLVEHVAGMVAAAAGSVTLVGHAGRYSHLGLRAIDDRHPDCGPLSGIEAALAQGADWSLVVACDMPDMDEIALRRLLEAARRSDADVVTFRGPSGLPEPVCAVYHRRCLPAVSRAVAEGRYKMMDVLARLRVVVLPSDGQPLENANTPEEWARILNRREVAID